MTTDELLAGEKTVTRRDWKESHLMNWQDWYDHGYWRHDAYDKIPIAGGEKIGEIYLTERPYWEKLSDMPESDLEKEGGMVDTLEEFYDLIGLPPSKEVAVIRFQLVTVL